MVTQQDDCVCGRAFAQTHEHTSKKQERERTLEEIKRGRTRNRYKKTAREGEIKKVRIKMHYITEKGSEKLVCTRA